MKTNNAETNTTQTQTLTRRGSQCFFPPEISVAKGKISVSLVGGDEDDVEWLIEELGNVLIGLIEQKYQLN